MRRQNLRRICAAGNPVRGAGYNAVRDALEGTLKLDAEVNVGVKVGAWQEKVWFKGGGIGASIRL
jgi:hypothetical protein